MSTESVDRADAVDPDGPWSLFSWGELDNRTHVWRARSSPPPSHEWERTLAAATARARSRSASLVADAVPGIDLGAVVDGSPLGVQVGRFDPAAAGFDSPAALAQAVDGALTSSASSFPQLAIAQGGAPQHVALPGAAQRPPAGRRPPGVHGGALAAAIHAGATLLAHHVDDHVAGLGRLLEHVERVTGTPCAANAYVGTAAGDGFGLHWDDHTVLVLQLDGAKSWEVRAPAVPHPLRPHVGDAVSDEVVWQGRLEPGDALLVPMGMGHRTTAHGPSWHLTIPIQPPRWLDIAGFCLSAAGHWPLLRGDVPFDPDAPVASYGPPVLARPEQFGDTLVEVFSDLTIDRALGQWLAKVGARPQMSLRALLGFTEPDHWLRATVRLAVPGGLLPAGDPDEGGSLGLAGGQRELQLPVDLIAPLLALAEAERVAVSELVGRAGPGAGGGPGAVAGLVRDLAVLGLLELVS